MSVREVRKPEYIKDKIKKFGSFENYIASISNSTVRNYKKIIELFIDGEDIGNEQKNKYRKILREKLSKNEYEFISSNIERIITQIEKSTLKSQQILTEDDYDFLLFILTSKISNKEKALLNSKDVRLEIKSGQHIIKIGEKKFILRDKKELFGKLFYTVDKQEQNSPLFKKRNFSIILNNYFIRLGVNKKCDINLFKKYISAKYLSETI